MHENERYDFDPIMFYENRFWNRRPDGIVINKNHRTWYILEFKRWFNRNKDFLRVKEDEANEQYKSIIEALKAAAPEWTFEQINFVAGRQAWCRSGRWQARKAQCTSREKGQDAVGACAAHMQSAWHSNVILLSGRLGLMRQRRWRTLENNGMCK